MPVTLDDKSILNIRNLIKNLYESYGKLQGAKTFGVEQIEIDDCINVYKSYIAFAEEVIQERNINKAHSMKET